MGNYTDGFLSRLKGILKTKETVETVHYETAHDAMCAALTAMNSTHSIEQYENTQDKVIYFKYQGMNFRAFTFEAEKNNDCNLDFHAGVYEASDLEYIRQVCNRANSAVNPAHFYYIADTKENKFNLYATCTLTNVPELYDLQSVLNVTLDNFFNVQRSFDEAIKKLKEENIADEDVIFMDNHEVWMTREIEITLQDQQNLLHDAEPHTLLLTDFLEYVYSIQSVEIEYIDVCASGTNKHITDTEHIHSYLLLESVVAVQAEKGIVDVKNQATTISVFYLTAEGKMRSVMITLCVENDEKNAVYIRVTAMRQGDCISMDSLWGSTRNLPKAVSYLLAVDRASEANRRAEVKYMWEEACRKKLHNEVLSDDERYLVGIAALPQIGDLAYLGKKCFNNKRFTEALKYFESLNEYLEKNFYEDFWTDKVREFFAHNCFYISYCYCEQGNPALGVFYAEKSCLIYPSHIHIVNYIKTLFKANDFRLFHEIRSRLADIEEEASKKKDDEPINEAQAEMYDFLQQSLIFALLRFGKIEEGVSRLQAIIAEGPDHLKEWAKNLLAKVKENK